MHFSTFFFVICVHSSIFTILSVAADDESSYEGNTLSLSAFDLPSQEDSSEEISGNDGGEEVKNIWAVLVAGSNGWYNYRHQADVCHAYHTLINHGVAPERIVTMMYDDIAYNKLNPYKGKIFNAPNGSDVYAGVKIDYSGKDVNLKNFEAVLTGNEQMSGGKRVLKSSENDKVFIYFTDHGAVGLICFPREDLTMKDLHRILKKMQDKKMYSELTFYLEACESGSMFDHALAQSMKIYAVTAANGKESSWGCYCTSEKLPGNCLGDLFSVSWMQDSDSENLLTETLEGQYEIVRQETNRSHVMQFGDMDIDMEYVSEFMGNKQVEGIPKPDSPHNFQMLPSLDIPLYMMARQMEESNSAKARHQLHVAQKKRSHLEQKIQQIVGELVHDPNNRRHVLTVHPGVIRNMDCHHQVVHTFSNFCFKFSKNPYALKYVYVLANLCDRPELDAQRIQSVLMEQCADVTINGIL